MNTSPVGGVFSTDCWLLFSEVLRSCVFGVWSAKPVQIG